MESFTPLTAALGCSLIDLAAAVLWLGNGRLAGIVGPLVPPAQTALVVGAFAAAKVDAQ